MPAIVRSARLGPHPIEILRAAVQWAREQGIAVVPGELGVHCTSSVGLVTWEMDRDGVVSPTGAALLHAQPQCPDVERALQVALDAPASYVTGLEAGIAKAEPSEGWLRAPNARVFLAAFEQGLRFRGELFGRPQLGSVPGPGAN